MSQVDPVKQAYRWWAFSYNTVRKHVHEFVDLTGYLIPDYMTAMSHAADEHIRHYIPRTSKLGNTEGKPLKIPG
eukprot:scaffold96479_cov21-Tisochrysis_lutea.AAC.1